MTTWYPTSEEATIRAIRMAAKHGTPEDALFALKRHEKLLSDFPRAVYSLKGTRMILETWAEWERKEVTP